MKKSAYIEEMKLRVTGGLLTLEIGDDKLSTIVDASFREVQRYIDTTKLITVPFVACIDLAQIEKDNKIKISAVARVFRSQSYMNNNSNTSSITQASDPLYASQIQILSGAGSVGDISNWTQNYAAYNTLLQIKNTLSTDLLFKQDKADNKLYINCLDNPGEITVEYVPRFDQVEEITSDYWIDIISRMSTALLKIALGRIRSRYTQSNALWTQDGETMLSEGNAELDALREQLNASSQLNYPID